MKRYAVHVFIAVASLLVGAMVDRWLVGAEIERMRGYVAEAVQQYVDCYVRSERAL